MSDTKTIRFLPADVDEERKPRQGESQEDYCADCLCSVACNVMLRDDESCGDYVKDLGNE